jgi:hypothetical protein
MPPSQCADGSGAGDVRPRLAVDREREPYRLRCPNGHTDWEPTNSHAWCRSCSRQSRNGGDVDAEHWELFDAKRDETVSYARIDFE